MFRRFSNSNMKFFGAVSLTFLLFWLISSIDLMVAVPKQAEEIKPKEVQTPIIPSDKIPVSNMNSKPSSGEAKGPHISRDKVVKVGSPKDGNDFPLETLQKLYSQALTPDLKSQIWGLVRKDLPRTQRKRILVTGGAGFVGSHLVDRLMLMGHYVIVVDNFFTGNRANIAHWEGHVHFEWRNEDVINPIFVQVDQIYHLACPASPPHYQYNPIKTIKTSTLGTINMLGLAKRVKARFLLTSTSEVYGDPEVSPQKESYWGHVNPIGPRACYDEGKRVAETLSYAYRQETGVDVRVARIFNTFGPRMHENDGRVVSNFILQAIRGTEMTIYGEGQQTRSFQYVHDLVDGLMALMTANYTMPVNLGNPDEFTIKEFADYIKAETGSSSKIVHLPATQDDPKQRRPDITIAQNNLAWEPRFSVSQGIQETIQYFKRRLDENDL